MSEIRYASDKPKECKYCYYWEGKRKAVCSVKSVATISFPLRKKRKRRALVMAALMGGSVLV